MILAILHQSSRLRASSSFSTSEGTARFLQERKARAAEYCLRGVQRVDFTIAGFFAHIKVFQQPITLRVQGCNVLQCCSEFASCRFLFVFKSSEVHFKPCPR